MQWELQRFAVVFAYWENLKNESLKNEINPFFKKNIVVLWYIYIVETFCMTVVEIRVMILLRHFYLKDRKIAGNLS